MAHAWNVTDGDIYVSKNGDDVAGDGSMAAPYASINKATTVGYDGNKIVIGSGVWQEARGISTNKYHYVGDGETVLYVGLSVFQSLFDEEFTNLKLIGNNTDFTPVIPFVSYDARLKFNKCKSYDFYITGYTATDGNLFCEFTYCYNQHIGFNNRTRPFTFVSKNSTHMNIYTMVNGTVGSIYSLFYNGGIVNSIIFNCPLFKFSSAAHVVNLSYSIIYNSNDFFESVSYNMNEVQFLNPKFNNSEIGDYTLKPDSPALFAGKNNSTIGAFGLGYSFDANSSELTKEGGASFSQTISVDDIIRTQQVINGITRFLFQLNSGHASGSVESAWIDLQQIRYLLITRLFANIIYNASGVATSRPDNLESAGEKAVYYDFELKYCNEESEKETAVWKNVIWNKAVTIDNSGNGNADPSFAANEAQYISARFIKIKLYMTEA